MDEKNEQKLTAFQKVDDWYAKHNFGTRLSMMVFIGMYILVVASTVDYSVFESIDSNATKAVTETLATNANPSNLELVKIVGYFAFGAMILITLGDNALTKIGDIIIKLKGGKLDESIN